MLITLKILNISVTNSIRYSLCIGRKYLNSCLKKTKSMTISADTKHVFI